MTETVLQPGLRNLDIPINNGPIILYPEDFQLAEILYEQEEKVEPFEENLFPAAVFCMLSATEDHEKQVAIFERLKLNGYTTPGAILDARDQDLWKVMRQARYPNEKKKRLIKLAAWWEESDISKRLLDDIHDFKRKNEIDLRNRIASKEGAPGLKEKCASYFMGKIGYQNVVPVDLWVTRYLANLGQDVKIPNYRTQSGPTGRVYLRLEKVMQEIAIKEYDTSPAHFQRALWVRMSGWKPNQGLNVQKRVQGDNNQLRLPWD